MAQEWLTPADLAGFAPDLEASEPGVELCVDAAAAFVESRRDDVEFTGRDVPADLRLGSVMLAYRLWQRRKSPLGSIGSPTDLGAATEIFRHDPDIARLLRTGTEGAFVFGAGRPRQQPMTTDAPVMESGA